MIGVDYGKDTNHRVTSDDNSMNSTERWQSGHLKQRIVMIEEIGLGKRRRKGEEEGNQGQHGRKDAKNI